MAFGNETIQVFQSTHDHRDNTSTGHLPSSYSCQPVEVILVKSKGGYNYIKDVVSPVEM
jgi:hypothetical protein